MADETDSQIIESFVQGSNETADQPATDEEVIEEFTETKEEGGDGEDKGEGGDEEDEDKGDKGNRVTQETVKFLEKASRKAAQGSDWLAALPTPGGIGLLLLAIILILWTLIPTKSGYTRLQLLWMVIHDQVRLTGAQYPDESQNAFATPTSAFVQPTVTNPVSLELAQLSGGILGLPGTTGGTVTPLSVPDFSNPVEPV